MVRRHSLIWCLLLGWLWLQPALALHQIESLTPDHADHCPLCAAHLDGKLLAPLALPTLPVVHDYPIPAAPLTSLPLADAPTHYAIRAPPSLSVFSV